MVSAGAKRIKNLFLYTLIASVVLSALLGVISILRNKWSWYDLRILLTTITISGSSICGLACGASLAARRGTILPIVGICLALISGLLLIFGIWLEPHSEAYGKLTVIVSTFAIASAHLSLLSMALLARKFQWILYVGYFFILSVAMVITLMILKELNNDNIWRLLAVAAIGAATVTVITPIFHLLSRRDRTDTVNEIEMIDEEIANLKERIAALERRKQNMAGTKTAQRLLERD